MNNLTKEELKNIIIIGFNLYATHQHDIMTKVHAEKLINDEVEKIIKIIEKNNE